MNRTFILSQSVDIKHATPHINQQSLPNEFFEKKERGEEGSQIKVIH